MTDSIKAMLDKLAELNLATKDEYELNFHSKGSEFYNGKLSYKFQSQKEFFDKADNIINDTKKVNDSILKVNAICLSIHCISEGMSDSYKIKNIEVKVKDNAVIKLEITQGTHTKIDINYTMSFHKEYSEKNKYEKVIQNLQSIKSRFSRGYSLDKLVTNLRW